MDFELEDSGDESQDDASCLCDFVFVEFGHELLDFGNGLSEDPGPLALLSVLFADFLEDFLVFLELQVFDNVVDSHLKTIEIALDCALKLLNNEEVVLV